MKNYTITVNGNVYNVTVEEGQTSGAPAAAPANDGFMNIPDGIDEELPFN